MSFVMKGYFFMSFATHVMLFYYVTQ